MTPSESWGYYATCGYVNTSTINRRYVKYRIKSPFLSCGCGCTGVMMPSPDTEDSMRTTIALAVIALGLPALPAGAQAREAVAAVAAHSGYTYRWSTQGSVLVLSRPGIVVVLRPGEQVYQVNDHDEVADAAPSYSQGDL